MAATTTLLGLVTPTQGTLTGTWGDTVNYGISDYLDIAIAGTLSFAGDGAITLANTTGSSSGNSIGATTAQYAIIKVTGTLTTAKIITGPSYSKTYFVVNAATGSTVTFKASGQTGVSIAVGETALVYYNGTDYVKVVGTATAGAAGGSTTQVQYNNAGVLAGITGATTNGTTLTLVAPILGSPFSVGTMPAFTLGGTVSGGGNQINNVVIGTTTPLAGAFTTLSATGTLSGGTSGTAYSFSGSAPATSLTLDASGNLGIGTTSPTKKLSITGTGNNETSGSIQTTNTNAGTGTQVGLWASNGTQSAQFSLAGTGYTGYGAYAAGNVVIYNDQAITLMADNASTGIIKFATGGSTEKMRLDTSGIVTMNAYGAGAATFSSAGVISSVSDETWKIKDGVPVDTDAMLKKLEPGYWYYNDEKKETFGADRQLGFYAQNVNAAIGPEAAPIPETITTKNKDGIETTVTKPWGYYDRSVLAITVMSLQKALATIETLTARITALETA